MSVLIVSNDKATKDTVFRLKKDGYHVLTARNEQEALNVSENTLIDLLLWDTSTCREEGNEIKHHLKTRDNADFIQLPIPGSYGAELGVDPRVVTALQQKELLQRVQLTLQQHHRTTSTDFHRPSFLDTFTRNSARWVQSLSQSFADPSEQDSFRPPRPTEQPTISSSGVLTLPASPSILTGLITFDPSTTAWIYLVLLTLAEICTFILKPQIGLAFHGTILMLLLVNAAFRRQETIHRLLLGLTFVPMIRILSLSLPMINLPRVYWYIIIAIPLLAVAVMMLRILQFSWSDVGLNLQNLPVQIPIGLTGLVFGYVFYIILKPLPLIYNLTWPNILIPALIVFVGTGFTEEFLFRGILQRAATGAMGRAGILYIAGLYTNLHIGHRSLLNPICALVLSLFLGWMVYKTRSLLGVTLCHGITNIMLFLVMPFLL